MEVNRVKHITHITKKLADSGVLSKLKTLSLARLNLPFLRTKRFAGIWKKNIINNNLGYAYANGFIVLVDGRDVFRLVAFSIGGKINSSRTLFFSKRTSG